MLSWMIKSTVKSFNCFPSAFMILSYSLSFNKLDYFTSIPCRNQFTMKTFIYIILLYRWSCWFLLRSSAWLCKMCIPQEVHTLPWAILLRHYVTLQRFWLTIIKIEISIIWRTCYTLQSGNSSKITQTDWVLYNIYCIYLNNPCHAHMKCSHSGILPRSWLNRRPNRY